MEVHSVSELSMSGEFFPVSDRMNKYQALFVAVNVKLGMGPLILPCIFIQAGALLGTMTFVIIAITAYLSSEFLIEAIGICNFLKNRKEATSSVTSEEAAVSSPSTTPTAKQKGFYMIEKFEISEIAGFLFNTTAQFVVTLLITLFLCGMLIIKGIISSQVISAAFPLDSIFGNYHFWMISIFTFGVKFSFRNISYYANIQEYIAIIRLFVIYAIIFACLYQIYQHGEKASELTSINLTADINNFSNFFSCSSLLFLLHFSIPSIVKPIFPQTNVRWVIRSAFLVIIFLFAMLITIAIVAFGPNLQETSNKIKFLHENFSQNQPITFYTATVYAALIPISFPLIIITTRNTLMLIFSPSKIPEDSSKITPWTFAYTFLITGITAGTCYIQPNLLAVQRHVGGILANIVLFIIPSILVIQGRRKLKSIHLVNYKDNQYLTSISSFWLPYVICIFGILVIIDSVHSAFTK